MDQIRRHRERGHDDRETLDEILDSGIVGTLSTVAKGRPWVVPMLYARDGDRILLHGSTGAGALRHVAAGAEMALCVTHVDAMVVAHSTFDSSANYRSAVVRGVPVQLDAQEQAEALDRIAEHLIPGRTAEVRATTGRERAATLCMSLPITEGQWTAKVRQGLPGEPDGDDVGTDAWCGVVPLSVVASEPETAPWSEGIAVPESVRRLSDSSWARPPR